MRLATEAENLFSDFVCPDQEGSLYGILGETRCLMDQQEQPPRMFRMPFPELLLSPLLGYADFYPVSGCIDEEHLTMSTLVNGYVEPIFFEV